MLCGFIGTFPVPRYPAKLLLNNCPNPPLIVPRSPVVRILILGNAEMGNHVPSGVTISVQLEIDAAPVGSIDVFQVFVTINPFIPRSGLNGVVEGNEPHVEVKSNKS